MELRLNQIPPLSFQEYDEVKVAVTTMAFKNAKIINLLRERGNYIKSQKVEQQQKIEQ